MRRLAAALFLILTQPALAQQPFRPCPYVTGGWSLTPQPPVTAVIYDTTTALLYVVFSNTQPHAFSNVPPTVMQAFSRAPNYVAFYNSAVVNSFHEMLLNEQNSCPLFWETGVYLWTH